MIKLDFIFMDNTNTTGNNNSVDINDEIQIATTIANMFNTSII